MRAFDWVSGNWNPLKGTRRLPRVGLFGSGHDNWYQNRRFSKFLCHFSKLSGYKLSLCFSLVHYKVWLEMHDELKELQVIIDLGLTSWYIIWRRFCTNNHQFTRCRFLMLRVWFFASFLSNFHFSWPYDLCLFNFISILC